MKFHGNTSPSWQRVCGFLLVCACFLPALCGCRSSHKAVAFLQPSQPRRSPIPHSPTRLQPGKAILFINGVSVGRIHEIQVASESTGTQPGALSLSFGPVSFTIRILKRLSRGRKPYSRYAVSRAARRSPEPRIPSPRKRKKLRRSWMQVAR